jgi:AraC-like DNA-binding protein
MACAYLFFGAVNILEYSTHSADVHLPLTRTVTLVVACSQAFLFTYTLITLVNINFVTRRRIIRELSLVALFITAAFVVYFTCSEASSQVFFYVFMMFYIFLLIRFTRIFLSIYRDYCLRMNNYFTEQESPRLRWVYFTFFAALAIGVSAMLSALFMSPLGSLLFSVVMMAFYLYFGIRFISYASIFQHIETSVFVEKTIPDRIDDGFCPESRHDKLCLAISDLLLKDRIYRNPTLTRDNLVERLGTNKDLFIDAFQHCFDMSFPDCINKLRLEDSVILLEQSDLSMEEISGKVGFGTDRTFRRRFQGKYNMSPKDYRKLSKEKTDVG